MSDNVLNYKGTISASKSIMNRLLVCASYTNDFKVLGDSKCDDVSLMRQGLINLNNGDRVNCGSAGTVFRFLALKASRMPGTHYLMGSERLLSRPQQALKEIFKQLAVEIEFHPDHVIIKSSGWKNLDKEILIDRSQSSQFATGMAISAWGLPEKLKLKWTEASVSEGYWQMTVELLKDLGMELIDSPSGLTISANQNIKIKSYRAETDLSSCFAVAAMACVRGSAHFENFPIKSLQPDSEFVSFLKKMEVNVTLAGENLMISGGSSLAPISCDLNNCPDLFPVLSVLCALADGESKLTGAPHLKHKESDRLEKSAELVRKMGRKCEVTEGGMIIHGSSAPAKFSFTYDTDEDHRLAFAAALAKYAGFDVQILNPEVVSKSFPEFWSVVKVKP